MKLSSNSLDRLAEEIAPKVYSLMCNDLRYVEALQNSVVSATSEVMGDIDPRIIGNVANKIIDMIGVDDDSLVWRDRYETLYRYVKTHYAESYVDGAEYGNMYNDYGAE